MYSLEDLKNNRDPCPYTDAYLASRLSYYLHEVRGERIFWKWLTVFW